MNLLVFTLLLGAAACSANKDVESGIQAAPGSKAATMQPWLVGLTAVVGFLLIVFAVLIIHRLLKNNREDSEGWDYAMTEDMTKGRVEQTSL